MRGRNRESAFWAARKRCPVAEGELRLLSAWEVLETWREGREMAQSGREQALCSNACLIARALLRNGKPVYESGQAVLESLSVEDITRLAEEWGTFNRACNPSPTDSEEDIEARKKVWSTRRMRAFNGVCSVPLVRFRPKNGRRI